MLYQWYKTDIDLYLKELSIIEKKIIDFFPYGYKENKDLCVAGRIDVDGTKKNILISYSRTYPSSPPKVWLFESDNFDKTEDFHEHFHQNYDESLCLFTSDWGEGSWHFNMDTQDVIEKLKESLRKAKNQEHLDEHTSIINPVPGKIKYDFEIYIPVEILSYIIKSEKSKNNLELYKFLKNNQGRILKFPSNNNIMEKIFENNSWMNFELLKNPLNGCYLKLPFYKREFRNVLGKKKNLNEFLKAYGFSDKEELNSEFIFLLFKDTRVPDSGINNPEEFKNMISYVYLLENMDLTNIYKIPMYQVYSVNFPDDIFQRTNAIFNKLVKKIRDQKVLIMGLGTIGSFIILELVKSGIKNFILYDFEIFQHINICRHIGDIKDIGKYKVDVVSEKIKLKNPEVNVIKRIRNPFERDKYLLDFIEDLNNSDIVVDTTASYQANLQLNKISIEYDKPTIYAWCGPNAESGRVFRVLPKKTPCYYCINLQLEKEPKKFPRIKKQKTEYEVPQYAGYRQPGIPGISIDINFISLFAARLVIQTLLIDEEDYPDAFTNHYIWQNKPSEIEPFDEIKLIPQADFRVIKRCPFCKQNKKKMFNQQKKKQIDKILEKGKKNWKKIV